MSTKTQQPPEVFIDLPLNRSPEIYTPEPRQWTAFVRSSLVPRMFKAANGGAASRDGHGWPYDMSIGTGRSADEMGRLPHPTIQRLIPDRRSGLTASGDALRTASTQRIPPVLVRTRLR